MMDGRRGVFERKGGGCGWGGGIDNKGGGAWGSKVQKCLIKKVLYILT